ncbi:hypothetical protein ACIBCD_25155 [Nocardia brasiliensis]|uniref:hypothetical protein n=1 Tax=Nocardia brasiliensis TaxID=37326 RepID=UPI0024559939|nr:hypothetical protein [Nocardia brasiliensis]
MHVRIEFSVLTAVTLATLSLSTTVASAALPAPHQLSAADPADGDYSPEQRAADEKTAATQGPGLEQQRADAQRRLKEHPATAAAHHHQPAVPSPVATHFAAQTATDFRNGPVRQADSAAAADGAAMNFRRSSIRVVGMLTGVDPAPR